MILSLGGYTCLRPRPWRRFLWRVAYRRYPWYSLRQLLPGSQRRHIEDNNCILDAVEDYLFHVYGLLTPNDTLFPVYNGRGAGLLPADILPAIRAVVEPLGFEIDSAVVPDNDLRQGLAGTNSSCYSTLLVSLDEAAAFHDKPGIAMINIKNGYSHAFYWDCMDARKFGSPEFRLAVKLRSVKNRGENGFPRRSQLDCLLDLCALAIELSHPGHTGAPLRSEAETLRRRAQSPVPYESLQENVAYLAALAKSGGSKDWETLSSAVELAMRVLGGGKGKRKAN